MIDARLTALTVLESDEKQCTKCSELKKLSQFNKDKKNRTGYGSWCRSCKRELDRAKRQPLKVRHSLGLTRQEYYQLEKAAGESERYRRWRKANLLKKRELNARYKALKRNAQIEPVDYALIAERDDWFCYLCKQDVVSKEKSFDHVIPLSKGGTHTYDNIKLTHLSCNLRKKDKLGYE